MVLSFCVTCVCVSTSLPSPSLCERSPGLPWRKQPSAKPLWLTGKLGFSDLRLEQAAWNTQWICNLFLSFVFIISSRNPTAAFGKMAFWMQDKVYKKTHSHSTSIWTICLLISRLCWLFHVALKAQPIWHSEGKELQCQQRCKCKTIFNNNCMIFRGILL